MKRFINNKVVIKVFQVLVLLFILSSAVALIIALTRKNSIFDQRYLFSAGLILASIITLYAYIIIHLSKTNKIKNITYFKKNNWIVWILSLVVIVLLSIAIYQVFYRLHNTVFPQAVGSDQTAYLLINLPFIVLSGFALLMLIYTSLVLGFISEEN